jgi:hypothetical protein
MEGAGRSSQGLDGIDTEDLTEGNSQTLISAAAAQRSTALRIIAG